MPDTQKNRKTGAWVVTAGSDMIIESSELRALRLAVAAGGTAQFVKFGCAIGDGQTPEQTIPKTSPIPKSQELPPSKF